MTESFSMLVDRISAAMTVSSLRNQVISTNIANHGVPGHTRSAVVFDQAMRTAFEQQLGATGSATQPADVLNYVQVVQTPAQDDASSLETDVVDLSSNALQYQVLARTLNRYFSIASLMAMGGKG